jgi:hypothetical protein
MTDTGLARLKAAAHLHVTAAVSTTNPQAKDPSLKFTPVNIGDRSSQTDAVMTHRRLLFEAWLESHRSDDDGKKYGNQDHNYGRCDDY